MKIFLAIITMALTGMALSAFAQPSDEPGRNWDDALGAEIIDAWAAPEHRAFDFWIGEWEMNWRSRPEGEFHYQKDGNWTHQHVFPILGGKAIVELAWARDNPDEASQRGFSIRYYDPARERWVMAQNWPSAANQGSAFLDQLIGDDHHGRLTMYSIVRRPLKDDSIDVQHRRYNFADIRPGVSFRWDGSNTKDEGVTWTTWSVVDAHRRRDLDPYTPAGSSFPGVHEKKLCTEQPHGAFDFLEGEWSGTVTDPDGNISDARYSAGLGLDGCGVLSSLEANGRKTFLAYGYNERHKKWVIFRLDDQPGSPHSYFVSDAAGEGAMFAQAPDLAISDEFTAYNLPEYFEPKASLQRVIWEKVTEREFTLRVETRANDGAEWRNVARYNLEKL